MDALGFRKSRREFKEANALNENGLENLDQDPMSEEEQETYIPSSEPLAEYEGFDGEEPPDNMPDSPEEDPGLQYDLENERWEINASAALQEGHEYGSDEFYSRIAELEEADRLAEEYEPSESDDEPPEHDMSLDDEALEIAVAESDDWEAEANSGALDERVVRIKQELQQENQ